MPLPPALAARLAKRGLLKDASVAGYDPSQGKVVEPMQGHVQGFRGRSQAERAPGSGSGVPSYGYEGRNLAEPEEEVFAENYDEQVTNQSYEMVRASATRASAPDPTRFIGCAGCPNKWNVYHDCQPWCKQFWGAGIREPVNKEYIEAHAKMVEKLYPLPDGWREMYDAGIGRHYYWCVKTNKVSWLPPGHPKAKITDAASKVREAMTLRKTEEKHKEENDDNMDLDSDNDNSDGEDRMLEEQRRREKEKRREEERRIVGRKRKGRGGDAEDSLDPMDPSAYSDVPRGSWSSGLEEGGGKRGVDSTASGPIFQQRPYPSPGDILRANAARENQ